MNVGVADHEQLPQIIFSRKINHLTLHAEPNEDGYAEDGGPGILNG